MSNIIFDPTLFKMSQKLTLTLGPRNQSIQRDGVCD
jgi:hypothetical protein